MLILLIGCSSRNPAASLKVDEKTTTSNGLVDTQTSFTRIPERGTLLVGTAISKPFEFHDPETNNLIGFDVDLVNYIAASLDVKPQFIEMSFANLIPALQENKVDLTIAAMYITPEREDLVDFSAPYFETGLVMVVQPELVDQIKSIDQVKGRKLGVKIGSTGAKLAAELNQRGYNLQITEYKDTLDSLLDLEVNRVDIIFNDYLNSLAYIKNSDSSLNIVLNDSGKPVFLSNVGLGIAVHQGNRELLEAIDAALADMKQSGTFQQLSEKWLLPEVD